MRLPRECRASLRSAQRLRLRLMGGNGVKRMQRPQGDKTRLGPLESAIQARDAELLIRTFRGRCEVDGSRNPCWIWKGARNSAGYAYMGRAGTNRIVHRVVA